jgi:hypothetical protein
MGFDLGNILQQYVGGDQGNEQRDNSQQAIDDFDRVAENANHADLASGVSEAFRSDQTPPFPSMVSQLFGQSDSNQRAGMLNQLIGGVGPGLLSSIAGGALGALFRGHEAPAQITPEQAATMSPDQVRQIAAEAEQHNPGVVDRMAGFYAQHPNLVKGLGGAALALVLGHMAQGMRR